MRARLRLRALPVLVLAFTVLGITAAPAVASAGSVDDTFGSTGKVVTDFGGYDYADAVAIQPDGKVVAAGVTSVGCSYIAALARYNPDGTLDTSFGSGGRVTTDFGHLYSCSADTFHALAILADGKILAAGETIAAGQRDFGFARYNANGSLDTAFGSGGKVVTDFGAYDGANALVIQPDGKFVAAGYANQFSNFGLARYNANGSLDTAFGSGGKVVTDLGGSDEGSSALVLQPDGKLVAAGWSGSAGMVSFALVRYNADGTLDTSFGSGGKVLTDLGGNDVGAALGLQTDGKLVVGGWTNWTGSGWSDLVLVRYNGDGSLDASFGTAGKVGTDFSGYDERLNGLVIQADGKIAVAGETANRVGGDFALARYNSDGTLDSSFDDDGKVTTHVGPLWEAANALAIQPDGKLVAAGWSGPYGMPNFTLVRYNANGPLDSTPPSITASASPEPNAAGWNNTEVTVTYTCTDDDSGVDAAASDIGPDTLTASGTATGTCVDKAGNSASASYTAQIDKEAPTVAGAATTAPDGMAGWYRTDVTVQFTCTDEGGGSGIPAGNCPPDQVLSLEGPSVSSAALTVTDAAGNASQPSNVVTVMIDKTAPLVGFSGNSGSYTVDQIVEIVPLVSDTISGVASEVCDEVHAAAYTFALGSYTLSCFATDAAGNVSSTTTTTFTISVSPDSLATLVATFSTDPAVAQGLTDKLTAIEAAAARGNTKAALNQLMAFRNQVDAQTGKALTAEQAVILKQLSMQL